MRPRFLLRRFHSLYTLHGTSDDMNEDCAVRIYVLYVAVQLYVLSKNHSHIHPFFETGEQWLKSAQSLRRAVIVSINSDQSSL